MDGEHLRKRILGERALNFVNLFINRWEEDLVDPEDMNHEWPKLYAIAKHIQQDAKEQKP